MLVRAHMCVLVMSCANPLMMCSLRFRAATCPLYLLRCVCVSLAATRLYLAFTVPATAYRYREPPCPTCDEYLLPVLGDFSFGIGESDSETLQK